MDDVHFGLEVDKQSHRLAEAPRARQLVAGQRVNPPVRREQRQPVRRLRVEVNERLIALAPFELGNLVEREVTLHRAYPAALRQDHGNRLLLDHRRPVDLARRRHFLDSGPPFVAELVLDPGQILLQPGALPLRTFDQPAELLAFLDQCVALAADLHLLELAQAAQAHVEDRLGLAVRQREFGHQHRLGLILGADDRDHPVEVEEGD